MKTKKLNNKGFSLVELICSVAILGIVIVPLLHSFVTSSNLTTKSIKQSESTLAAKNILEAVGTLPISEFQGGDKNKKIVNLLSPTAGTATDASSTALSVLSEPDALDNFSVVLDNVTAGNSVFDAKVEFSRGEETSPSSDGLYLINSDKIRLAQYDSMDGVFCQPYDIGSNPDVLVEDEMNSQAIIAGYSKENLIKRTREIRLDVEFDPNQEGTPGIPDSDRLHYAKITYSYRFTYRKTNPFSEGTYPWTRSYTIFPGGYAPKNKDNSLAIYLMIYPVFSDKYSSDKIFISNNSQHQYIVTDQDTGKQVPYTIPLNTYVYIQDPYDYNEEFDQSRPVGADNQEYVYTTPSSGSRFNEQITLLFPSPPNGQPSGYALDKLKDTHLYTNAKDISDKSFGSFDYLVQEGAVIGVGDDYSGFITPDLVRKSNKVKIYNIKITLYSDDAIIAGEDGKKVISSDAKPGYVLEGTKTN